MKVTPLDIRRKEFKRSVRGYSDEEVDLFLDEVADEFEQLHQANVELQERVRRMEEQLAGNAQLRDALEKTLVTAQLQADQTTANARKESELILRDSELKARAIVSDSYAEVQRVQQALIQLKHLEEDFRFKFRSLLEGHLKLLDEAPINMGAAQPVVVQPGIAEPAAAASGSPFEVPTAVEEVPEFPVVAQSAVLANEPSDRPAGAADAGAAVLAGAMTGLAEPAPVVAAESPSVVPPASSDETAAMEETVAMEYTMATEETVVVERPLAASAADAVEPSPSEVPDIWGDDEPTAGDAVPEAGEKPSIFAEFDEADARAGKGGAGAAASAEDPLSGFFFSGRPDDQDDTFLDGDKDGKTKARDFEW